MKLGGRRFNSIGEASRILNESETRLRCKLHNKAEGYVIVEKVEQGYSAIMIDGAIYESIIEAVQEGKAKDRFQAMRRLNSRKYKNWNYISEDKKIQKD